MIQNEMWLGAHDLSYSDSAQWVGMVTAETWKHTT